ncbi:Malectin/receptor protein kinase family protein [Hibiscus syriacus]|uniref:Malectin/receptor protein kinase family protein n=1 Tax=Hibiscus syriacus TaxID=106335 RepID=A0A6A2WFY1_HIBSY|nr:receptor-like protein kinase FERONIA [Hibiscus syriacus]KAE8654935.1 Malectin/receptor protein kinase family protein [Hibiscus syriacus]
MKNPLCSLPCFSVSKKKYSQLYQRSQLPEGLCRHFSLAQIKAATDNFNEDSIIGRGDYGTAYKGTTNDGTIVVLKRWQSESGSYLLREMQNEVRFLCQLRHPHLASLIGICEEGNEAIPVYEYMSGGALSDRLYGQGYAPLLWKQRLQICVGAARGLHYLHTGAKYALFHGHITSRNLLLNEELSCKITDFGLSKLGSFCMSKASKVRRESKIKGIHGYMAPEYAMHGELTEKSDVFSFGVVLFEVLFGRPEYDSSLPEEKRYLFAMAMESIIEGTIYHAIDPQLKGRIAPECLNKYLEIAFSCVHDKGSERPEMGEVEVTLELALELQDRADAEMEAINPCGQYMHDEAPISIDAETIKISSLLI